MDEFKKLKKFWKGKKVLITGHTGFKGSWMCIFLNMLDAKIIGYSLKPKKKSLFNKSQIKKFLKKNIYNDIQDFEALKKVINNNQPEIIFHLASQAIVSESFKNPLHTIYTNIIGTTNLLECLKNNNSVKSVVIVTTDKVYKIKKKRKYKEDDEIGGIDPYSASKACKEIIVNSYSKSFFLKKKLFNKISTARSGNVIGGGDYSKDRLVPDIISSFKHKKPLLIRNPSHIRPWQHVIEPTFGYLLLAQKQYLGIKQFSNIAWNFGPDSINFLRVNDLVKLFSNIIGKKMIVRIKKSKYLETKILKLDNKKSKKNLNWKPKWNVKTALKKTIELENLKNSYKNIKNVCEKQIYSYLLR